jgi:hypothetical protein
MVSDSCHVGGWKTGFVYVAKMPEKGKDPPFESLITCMRFLITKSTSTVEFWKEEEVEVLNEDWFLCWGNGRKGRVESHVVLKVLLHIANLVAKYHLSFLPYLLFFCHFFCHLVGFFLSFLTCRLVFSYSVVFSSLHVQDAYRGFGNRTSQVCLKRIILHRVLIPTLFI